MTALLDADSGLDREAAQAQVDAVSAAWTAGARAYGELREDVLRAWAAWDVEFGILEEEPDVEPRLRHLARRAGLQPLTRSSMMG